MTKYSVAKGQNKESILEIDGLQSICPFTPAIPIPGSVGQIQIMRMPCTSNCPHASHNEEVWLMTCSGKELKFKLEKKEEEPKLESKVIHLGQ
jgi:hypothetical protein